MSAHSENLSDDSESSSQDDSREGNNDQNPTQATQLVMIASKCDVFNYQERAYAIIPKIGHDEVWPICSKRFKQWLKAAFFEKETKPPCSQALKGALGIIEAEALFCGPIVPVYVRIASHEGVVYLDLVDVQWRVLKIGKDSWQFVSKPPIRFLRKTGMQSLPNPEHGGSLDELRPFVNVANDADFILIVSWLVGSFRVGFPMPVLILNGEQGSAKTTTVRILRALADPNIAPTRNLSHDCRDLMIQAQNSHIQSFDNISHISDWMSDAICRLSTGGGLSTRTLYENDEETIFQAQRPVMINGIGEVATRPDLLDRAIVLTLPTIADSDRRNESELVQKFEEARPRIFGALLTAITMALRRVNEVELSSLPRMADFAQWVVAAESALPWSSGDFLSAYLANRKDANLLAIETSPIGDCLLLLIQSGRTWNGTITQLLESLSNVADSMGRRQIGWPRNPRALSQHLGRITPVLRAVGIDIHFDRTSKNRSVTIRRSAE